MVGELVYTVMRFALLDQLHEPTSPIFFEGIFKIWLHFNKNENNVAWTTFYPSAFGCKRYCHGAGGRAGERAVGRRAETFVSSRTQPQ